jgi:hypothetical protein
MTKLASWRTRLARRLCCDGNPMRRRCDVIEAWLLPATVVAFVGLCPVAVLMTGNGVRSGNVSIERAESTWHPVRAVMLRSVPGQEQAHYGGTLWLTPEPARWTADGRRRTGDIPVPAGTMAGAAVTAWVDQAGNPRSAPMTRTQATGRVIEASVGASAGLAALLILLMLLARMLLDRRRIAGWESAWLSVGPVWTRHR